MVHQRNRVAQSGFTVLLTDHDPSDSDPDYSKGMPAKWNSPKTTWFMVHQSTRMAKGEFTVCEIRHDPSDPGLLILIKIIQGNATKME